MPNPSSDPYRTLGVSPGISDPELRAAYRRLVQLHHPDHNGGSAESAQRFEEIQAAYARVRELRTGAPPRTPPTGPPRTGAPPRTPPTGPPRGAGQAARPPSADPEVEARLADLERQLREASAARERARKAARKAAAQSTDRPSDEELGYVTTDDSFSKILDDARSQVSDWLGGAREKPVTHRVSELIDELDQLASRLTGERPRRPRPSSPPAPPRP